jgi:hypothetical protein
MQNRIRQGHNSLLPPLPSPALEREKEGERVRGGKPQNLHFLQASAFPSQPNPQILQITDWWAHQDHCIYAFISMGTSGLQLTGVFIPVDPGVQLCLDSRATEPPRLLQSLGAPRLHGAGVPGSQTHSNPQRCGVAAGAACLPSPWIGLEPELLVLGAFVDLYLFGRGLLQM